MVKDSEKIPKATCSFDKIINMTGTIKFKSEAFI